MGAAGTGEGERTMSEKALRAQIQPLVDRIYGTYTLDRVSDTQWQAQLYDSRGVWIYHVIRDTPVEALAVILRELEQGRGR